MSNKNKFSIRQRLKSFKYAFEGFKTLLKEEHNSRIHFIISFIVILLGFLLNLSSTEWLVILLLIALVISLEIINSAIENICDYVSPEWNSKIKKVKDLMAAAVLFSSMIAVICGAIIFIPRLCNLLNIDF